MEVKHRYVLILKEVGLRPEHVAEIIDRVAYNAEEETLMSGEALVSACEASGTEMVVSVSLSKDGAEMLKREIETAGAKCEVRLLGSLIGCEDPDLDPETNAALQSAYKVVEDKGYAVGTVSFKFFSPDKFRVWITGFSDSGEECSFKIIGAYHTETREPIVQSIDSGVHIDVEVGINQEPRKMSDEERLAVNDLVMQICNRFSLPDGCSDFLSEQAETLQQDCCFLCAIETLERMASHDLADVTAEKLYSLFWGYAAEVTTETHS